MWILREDIDLCGCEIQGLYSSFDGAYAALKAAVKENSSDYKDIEEVVNDDGSVRYFGILATLSIEPYEVQA